MRFMPDVTYVLQGGDAHGTVVRIPEEHDTYFVQKRVPWDPTQTTVSQATVSVLDFKMPEYDMYYKKWFHWRIEEAGSEIVECAPGAHAVGDLDVDDEIVIRFPVFGVSEALAHFAEGFLKLTDEYASYNFYPAIDDAAKTQLLRDHIKLLVPPQDHAKIPLADAYLYRADL